MKKETVVWIIAITIGLGFLIWRITIWRQQVVEKPFWVDEIQYLDFNTNKNYE
jgi:hypothetical protein